MKTCTRNNGGFTLLEVLVSLSIMAIITTVAFAGLSIGIDSWRRGTQKIEELDRRFALERLLQRQITVANPRLFRGDNRQLEFTSTYSIANGPGYPVWVKYVVDSNRFEYAETPLVEYVAGRPQEEIKETFSGLSSSGFRYLYATGGAQPSWVNQSMEALPLAVRVEIGGDILAIPLVNRK